MEANVIHSKSEDKPQCNAENLCEPFLPAQSPDKYKGRNFPSFRQPTELGSFSVDGERKFHPDQHQMKYLAMPTSMSRLNMDLNKGYSQVIHKNQLACEKIDFILRWILANRGKVETNFSKQQTSQCFGVDFVCFRGLLTTIICTLYESKEDWLICATKFRGTIYLCAFDTELKKEREKNRTEREKLMSAWGYKFEQYMTADQKHGTPNTEVPVNENEEYCVVIKSRLSNSSLLYVAETDGVNPFCSSDMTSTQRYVELKTSRMITSERQDENFCRYKLMKWWAQSFLVGIPKILCGFRDDRGIVHNLRSFNTPEMPKMAEGLWSASVGMNFCDAFLQFVNKCVVKDNPSVVYKFYWKPGKDVVWEELLSSSEYQILPPWYISAFT